MSDENDDVSGDIDDAIRKVLSNERVIEGYTITEIAEQMGIPFPTARWHLETLESEGEVTYTPVGRAKFYRRNAKKREKGSKED